MQRNTLGMKRLEKKETCWRCIAVASFNILICICVFIIIVYSTSSLLCARIACRKMVDQKEWRRRKEKKGEWMEKNKIETSHMYKKWNGLARALSHAMHLRRRRRQQQHTFSRVRARLDFFFVCDAVNRYGKEHVCAEAGCACVGGHRPNDSAFQSQRMGKIYHKRHMILFRKIAAGKNACDRAIRLYSPSMRVSTECTLLYSLHFIPRCNSFFFFPPSKVKKMKLMCVSHRIVTQNRE